MGDINGLILNEIRGRPYMTSVLKGMEGLKILWRCYLCLNNKKRDDEDRGFQKITNTKIAWRHLWTTTYSNAA